MFNRKDMVLNWFSLMTYNMLEAISNAGTKHTVLKTKRNHLNHESDG